MDVAGTGTALDEEGILEQENGSSRDEDIEIFEDNEPLPDADLTESESEDDYEDEDGIPKTEYTEYDFIADAMGRIYVNGHEPGFDDIAWVGTSGFKVPVRDFLLAMGTRDFPVGEERVDLSGWYIVFSDGSWLQQDNDPDSPDYWQRCFSVPEPADELSMEDAAATLDIVELLPSDDFAGATPHSRIGLREAFSILLDAARAERASIISHLADKWGAKAPGNGSAAESSVEKTPSEDVAAVDDEDDDGLDIVDDD